MSAFDHAVNPAVLNGVAALEAAGVIANGAAEVEAKLSITSGKELYDREYAPRKFLVEDVIAEGNLILLAGRPKAGKSWLLLQLAQALDAGGEWLGRRAKRARVLLITLEDGQRRIHERMHVMRWRPNAAGVATELPDSLAGRGMDAIRNEAESGSWDCIIIDSLRAAIRGAIDENANSAMAALVQGLADIAHQTNVTIILVHHTRKTGDDDPFNVIAGAGATRAAYDLGMVLDRKRGEAEAVLMFESRDLSVEDMTISFDASRGWSYAGSAVKREELRAGRRVVQVLDALERENADCDGWFSTEEIAQAMNVTRQAALEQLKNAERAGAVTRKREQAGKGKARDLWQLVQK